MTATPASERDPALQLLDGFVGTWSLEASFPGDPPVTMGGGRSVFEWMDGGQFLIQRTDIPDPDAPNSLAVIGLDPAADAYVQHYFDARGVARLYAMTFGQGVWTLTREAADFSPFDFRQRFTGSFSADGDSIRGAWELAEPGSGWSHDFDLSYTRVG
ncbi:MAG TPA: hypothetical protein VG412_09430 [Acidimicrobiales bacterium]|nr:hypothetical protein [Acidimicrobiales bacterium]